MSVKLSQLRTKHLSPPIQYDDAKLRPKYVASYWEYFLHFYI